MRRESVQSRNEKKGHTCSPTTRLMYHWMGSMTEVPQRVAVETEKNNILRKSRIGEEMFPSDTLFHPRG